MKRRKLVNQLSRLKVTGLIPPLAPAVFVFLALLCAVPSVSNYETIGSSLAQQPTMFRTSIMERHGLFLTASLACSVTGRIAWPLRLGFPYEKWKW